MTPLYNSDSHSRHPNVCRAQQSLPHTTWVWRMLFSSATLHLVASSLSGKPSSSCRFSPIYSASLVGSHWRHGWCLLYAYSSSERPACRAQQEKTGTVSAGVRRRSKPAASALMTWRRGVLLVHRPRRRRRVAAAATRCGELPFGTDIFLWDSASLKMTLGSGIFTLCFNVCLLRSRTSALRYCNVQDSQQRQIVYWALAVRHCADNVQARGVFTVGLGWMLTTHCLEAAVAGTGDHLHTPLDSKVTSHFTLSGCRAYNLLYIWWHVIYNVLHTPRFMLHHKGYISLSSKSWTTPPPAGSWRFSGENQLSVNSVSTEINWYQYYYSVVSRWLLSLPRLPSSSNHWTRIPVTTHRKWLTLCSQCVLNENNRPE